MATVYPDASTGNPLPQLTNYRYDQLNRIKWMKAYRDATSDLLTNNDWSSATNDGKYEEHFTYDGNGNILTLDRNGNLSGGSLQMDDLTYVYKTGTNKLIGVNDPVTTGTYTEDIDDQGSLVIGTPSTWNYNYDEIGNLVLDKQEEIADIAWTVYGKVDSVTRISTSTKPDLRFAYDASGNRIMKVVMPRTGTGRLGQESWTYTYYVRDAQGNVMATYKKSYAVSTGLKNEHLELKERNIYGSSRLGLNTTEVAVGNASFTNTGHDANGYFTGVSTYTLNTITPTTAIFRDLGEKQYELTSHLGNVIAVISDHKIAVDANTNNVTDYFTADVTSANDYYSFGSQMPGRSFNSPDYRYGFNGMEKDDEVTGSSGNNYTATFWEYDARTGRRWNLDPQPVAWWSPYSTFYGMPIKFSDPNGDCPVVLIGVLLLSSAVAIAPTGNPADDARIEEAKQEQNVGAIVNVLAPGAGKLIVQGAKQILPKLLVKQTGKELLEKAETKVLTTGTQEAVKQGEKPFIKSGTEFVKDNLQRFKTKLQSKIDKGEIPFEKSKAGFAKGVETIEKTVEKATTTTEAFIPKRAGLYKGERSIDIFSEETGFTVRVSAETHEFITIIKGATTAVKNAVANTTTK